MGGHFDKKGKVMNKDYYAPGSYNDPSAPWNEVDLTDSQEFEDEQLRQWDERIMDIHGYFIESLSESSDEDLTRLARMVRDNQNGTHTEAIGVLVTKLVTNYCKPSDDDVLEVLNEPPYDPEA